MMKSGEQLCLYAKKLIGTPYFYGAKIQNGIMTEHFMKQMAIQYPNIVTKNYMTIARNQNQIGKVNTDCSGLIAGYRGKNVGSAQLYQSAYTRLPISKLKDFANGTVLWKQGHVGIYVGMRQGVPICIEAKGIQYGTIETNVWKNNWMYGLTFSDMEYSYEVNLSSEATYKKSNPYPYPKANVKMGMRGDEVRWVQWELKEAGYILTIDGVFGIKTFTAVKMYQLSCKIVSDGIVGPVTMGYLRK